ncbi:hypothetical protein S7711_02674 [Stachybotrys chartarum IBT 7711]|uniref:Phospholipase/carboxylesterase/thioesterase domain-containing protein n=1 Tax=Stachybotrys chartarum (strain CBS 109288 / IBT 7711) TaxID=1280523 RepID=A0A084AYX7_STACB|nr:hypothetical protein S7711_02674 [Stachybotrys chartarum IBT 7711]KFA54372.1 hypothetical protein S40293_04347 [Stachybotrys chartarum IBT 40293]
MLGTTPAPVSFSPKAPHSHTVVFLHGRGDTAAQFSASLQYSLDSRNRTLMEAFPSFRWVFPSAPLEHPQALPAHEVWSQWFDIWNTRDFTEREELQAQGLRASVDRLRQLIATEVSLLGGQWDRLILAGISQGAATSVHTLLNLDIPQAVADAASASPTARGLGAFIGFSCRMPFPGRSLTDTRAVLGLAQVPDHALVLRHTPILLEHCADDQTVPVGAGRQLCSTLRGFGATVDWREYPNGGHWFHSPNGMDDVVSWLSHVLARQKGGDGKIAEGSAMDLS